MGASALIVIAVLGRWAPRLPATLIVVVGGIAAVALLDLSVDTVGVLPEGLPSFVLPRVPSDVLPELITAAFAIALVATADTSVLSQSLASRRKEEVDPDRELVALGVANFATGLFQGFPISSSASRTPVAIAAGARSQLTPLVGAIAVALMLVVAPALLRDLPQAVLGAVVVAAAARLVDVAGSVGSGACGASSSPSGRPRSSASRCSACCPGSSWRSCCPWPTSSAGRGGPTTPPSSASTS